jgi:hypothetical protein
MSIAADLIDKRVIRRYLERGVIDRPDFQQYIEQLPDCANRCVQATPDRGADDALNDAVS